MSEAVLLGMSNRMVRNCTLLLLLLCPLAAEAVENNILTRVFTEYENNIAAYVTACSVNDWEAAQAFARQLEGRAQALRRLAKQDENLIWESYANNLYHHSLELIRAAEKQDAVASTYLIAIHLSHLQQIQSANPRWLRQYVTDNIRIIEQGIVLRDQKAVRDAAEIVHASATKILMSVGAGEGVYEHTRWLATISLVNGLGDDILGAVNQGCWDGVQVNLDHIKHIIAKWTGSFTLHTGKR